LAPTEDVVRWYKFKYFGAGPVRALGQARFEASPALRRQGDGL